MKSSGFNWRPFRQGAVVAAVLAATGWALEPIERPAWEAEQAREPSLKLATVQAALGQGVMIGLLGGFRSLVADMLWVKAYMLWEDEDGPATQSCLRLVTTIDPRPLYFWLNSARMIANDMPGWRIDHEGGRRKVAQGRQEAINLEQAQVGLKILQEGLAYHPNNWQIYAEMGMINYIRSKDLVAAAGWYRLASEQPDAMSFCGRVSANLLEESGHYQEAYDWRKQLYAKLPKPTLTPDQALATHQTMTQDQLNEYGEVTDMIKHIRKLEQELHLPASQAFKP